MSRTCGHSAEEGVPPRQELPKVAHSLGDEQRAPELVSNGLIIDRRRARQSRINGARGEKGGDRKTRARGEWLDLVHVLPSGGKDDGGTAAGREWRDNALAALAGRGRIVP